MALPKPPPGAEGWRERVKEDLAAQIETGATLYGRRADGCFVARGKNGDVVLARKGEPAPPPSRKD